jgi:putative methionine-R-sulfoxide reductase with GAF domain
MNADLKRLVTRHRHVAPMLSALLAATDARLVITDAEGTVILHREGSAASAAAAAAGQPAQRFPVVVEGRTVGWVEGPRVASAVASVMSYAASREQDKRALAQEALDRYRELNLIYDLAEEIGATLEVAAVARVAGREASRLPSGGAGFILLRDGDGDALAPAGETQPPVAGARGGDGLIGAVLDGEAEIVNDVASDARASSAERAAIGSLIVAPLKVRGRRIGVIGAASTEPVEYRAADLKVLTAIAALAAPTLDQAATHEAALRAAGRT